jgi:hypothetical protein
MIYGKPEGAVVCDRLISQLGHASLALSLNHAIVALFNWGWPLMAVGPLICRLMRDACAVVVAFQAWWHWCRLQSSPHQPSPGELLPVRLFFSCSHNTMQANPPRKWRRGTRGIEWCRYLRRPVLGQSTK